MNQTVGHLKEKIKERKLNTIRFNAGLLKIYLARDNGVWLNVNSDSFKALEGRDIPDGVKDLMQKKSQLVHTEKLNNDAYFGKNFEPAENNIHVLVEMPGDPEFSVRSNLVTIICAIPGPGCDFPVDILMNQTVGHLKEKIKEEMPNMIYFDAGLLKLYLARDDGAWLNAKDDACKALERREIPDRVKNFIFAVSVTALFGTNPQRRLISKRARRNLTFVSGLCIEI